MTLAVVGAALALALGVEAALWLGVGLRTLVASVLALLVRRAGRRARRRAAPARARACCPGSASATSIRRAGEDHAGVDRRLAALLDLADGHASGSDRLREAALAGLAAEVEDVPFERVRAWGPARQRAALRGRRPLLALAVLFVAAPGTMSGAALRLMEPGRAFARPDPFGLRVDARATSRWPAGRGWPSPSRRQGRATPLAATLELGREGERAVETVRLRARGDAAGRTPSRPSTRACATASSPTASRAGGSRSAWSSGPSCRASA